jgi:hypothetical protein
MMQSVQRLYALDSLVTNIHAIYSTRRHLAEAICVIKIASCTGGLFIGPFYRLRNI